MTTSERARVLVVDDSALMRKVLADLLRSSLEIEVVGLARDGAEAVEMAVRFRPDVVTLDVEMPGMSGIETLPALFAVHETAVVMVSALTQEGAAVTLEALDLGAFDFLPKPERHQIGKLKALRDVLVGKVLAAAQSRVHRPRFAPAPRLPRPPSWPEMPTAVPVASISLTDCVVLGISTGGPQSLGQAFAGLAPPIPPVLVVQHMPASFTRVFAERLARNCELTVKEAEEGDKVVSDRILIAPGGRQMSLIGRAPRARITLTDGPPVSGHKPSVDVLFESASKAFGALTVGIIMTGMGRDGVDGCKKILAEGGTTFGQDEATSIVYGMNKAAFLEGAVRRQFALEELAGILSKLARKGPPADRGTAGE